MVGVYPTTTISFEVVLEHDTNDVGKVTDSISITYDDGVPSGDLATATIGIEAGGWGGAVEQLSCYSGTLRPIGAATVVSYVPEVPINRDPPVISGAPAVGQRLSVSTGAWTVPPDDYRYQWRRCSDSGCLSSVTVGTAATYAPVAADVGQWIGVVVFGDNGWGYGVRLAADVGPVVGTVVKSPPVNAIRPRVSGAPRIGATLKATHGSWTGKPDRYRYQWARCRSLRRSTVRQMIPGATRQTYRLAHADLHRKISVRVSAHNQNGWSAAVASSNAIGPVAAS